MVNDEIGKRMKDYETRQRYYLQRKIPVAIRVDMRAGHTFTRGFNKPFDEVFGQAMRNTMKYMCENIQGACIGYCESDEITIILQDYVTINTDAWFDYRVDKLCSIAASMATMSFNREFAAAVNEWNKIHPYINYTGQIDTEIFKQKIVYTKAIELGAMFDARCFNIPKEEVCNLIYWRQLDATRNSIQMVGQSQFSHSELEGKSRSDIQDMLMLQKNINWNDYPTYLKRGSACINQGGCGWVIDLEMPILKGEDREYVEWSINYD